MKINLSIPVILLSLVTVPSESQSWVRINQLGYLPHSVKVAVFISTMPQVVNNFTLCDAVTGKAVFTGQARSYPGDEWGMKSAARLDFTSFEKPGGYYIIVNGTKSPFFRLAADVYTGTADYLLKYMRQQRCGYNPWLRDSCHDHDGFIVDHPARTGEIIDARGGWHDASDYLQYVTTSANAVYQMMYAWRNAPEVFGDQYLASGDPGKNGIPDILDEALWGMEWLMRMNPDSGVMFNQIADDRDHRGFRLPNEDTASYGNGIYRPVYFVTGKSQGLARYRNRTEGVSSTAGKYASAFALGAEIFRKSNPELSRHLEVKAKDAYEFGLTDLGTTQTACNVSPYFYEEDNYVDDLELAAWQLFSLTRDSSWLAKADYWGGLEPVSPWIEKDTARHYQFYPFINVAHANLALSKTKYSSRYIYFMRKGLQILNDRRKDDPFQVKIPFTWCSNNFVNAALQQHMLYYEATGDDSFREQEAALRDWLFGCNPWGTSMVIGLPEGGDYPVYPHSAFTLHLGVPVYGGLIDGPVWSRIYKSLIGITLLRPDPYLPFQNGKAVYHDDIGDYSTNEPTMDGTADLTWVMSALEKEGLKQAGDENREVKDNQGAIIRINPGQKSIYLIFSADEYGEGAQVILDILKEKNIKGSFFLTGNFLRNPSYAKSIRRIISDKHFVGPHSDKHLLYASWEKQDSLLVSREEFQNDLGANYDALSKSGAPMPEQRYFLAPYEWYNSAITSWAADMGVKLINFTPGTGTNADYTTPDINNYRSSDVLVEKLKQFEKAAPEGLSGAFVLVHLGTDTGRNDKLYNRLGEIIDYYKSKGYSFNKL
jgi:peptidoglycan/xylan/chitin deacetylase (PgdA/CDA1 family)